MNGFVAVGKADELLAASARHHITLRHRALSKRYHSLLLFSFAVPPADSNAGGEAPSARPQQQRRARFYCMEAVCPHLGAPLENASIYDVEDEHDDIEDAVIVCPWHEYDFSLSTGESSTGLKACVYDVADDEDGTVFVRQPALEKGEESYEGAGWELIERRPVSEAFTKPQEARLQRQHQQQQHLDEKLESLSLESQSLSTPSSAIPDPEPLPSTLVEWAVLVLNTANPRLKVEYTRRAAQSFRNGQCRSVGGGRWSQEQGKWQRKPSETPPEIPPRLDTAEIVQPGRERRRGKGGSERSRIAMLHSLANIEQWAIDLAWDIIARAAELFSRRTSSSRDGLPAKLPLQFYADFVKVAEDEAKHFTLLQERLRDMHTQFGDLPVHHGLWDSARETMHSLDARLSIIHLVHEARGLDANPLTIKKFENAGDQASVETLTIIHLDEVTHVSAGHRWLTYICDLTDEQPIDVFRNNVRRHFAGKLKGPFNASDRTKAGLTSEWYDDLVGQKESRGEAIVGVQRAEIPGG